MPAQTLTRRPAASDRQIEFAVTIAQETATLATLISPSTPVDAAAAGAEARDTLAAMTDWRRVREYVDRAIARRDVLRREARALAPAPSATTETGATAEIAKGDVLIIPNGTVVRVKASQGTGNLYAMARGESDTAFAYAPGLLRRLSGARRLTMAEALTLSAAWGECVRCGRTLTAAKSVEAGIGPVCRKAFDA